MTRDQHDNMPEGADNRADDQEDAASFQYLADLLWEAHHGAPPLREDPVAAMLGLLPDPAYGLDPDKLKRARKRARLQISDLVARLTTRGWAVDRADVYRWENQSSSDVAPALIKALAEESGVSADQLVTKRTKAAVPSAVAAALASDAFAGLVVRWAKLQNVSLGLASSELESRMLTTVYRGDSADADQMLQSLEALLSASESVGDVPHEL